jgi:hypothetical protein
VPRELIFTSVPSGLKPGSSGYCTVARHEDMDPMLERELERLSFYEMDGGLHPVIHAFRILRLQSGNHYVLSRICYSGSDHTGRTNYIAHHLVFDETETYSLGGASPADYFLDTIGWLDEWPKGKQPVLFGPGEGEKAPCPASPPPASNSTWARITGDPLNAHEPLYRDNWRFITSDGRHAETLSLLSEFCSQPEVNVQCAWGTYTFTTFLQTSDQPSDFRCVSGHASGPVASVAHDTLHLDNSPATCFQPAETATSGALEPQHVPVVEQAHAEQSQDGDGQTLEQSFVDEGEQIIESEPAAEEPGNEIVDNEVMSHSTRSRQDDIPDPTRTDVRKARRRKASGSTRHNPFQGRKKNTRNPRTTGKTTNKSRKISTFSITLLLIGLLSASGGGIAFLLGKFDVQTGLEPAKTTERVNTDIITGSAASLNNLDDTTQAQTSTQIRSNRPATQLNNAKRKTEQNAQESRTKRPRKPNKTPKGKPNKTPKGKPNKPSKGKTNNQGKSSGKKR